MSQISKKKCDDVKQISDPMLSELTCGKIYRYFKRKRDMETSTPLNKRRDTVLIEEQEESPIGAIDQASRESQMEEQSAEDIARNLNPTGISDDLTTAHLTPPPTETSSFENRRLYTTTRNLTRAAESFGVIRRSSSLPNLAIELNQYKKRIITPRKNLARAASLDDIDLSPWELSETSGLAETKDSKNTEGDMNDRQGAARDLHAKSTEDPEHSSMREAMQKNPPGAGRDFQALVVGVKSDDPQGAACDLQISEKDQGEKDSISQNLNSYQNSKGAACDLHSPTNRGEEMTKYDCGTVCSQKKVTGAIPKKIICPKPRLDLGLNATIEMLNETPVGISSPKRRLMWSPQTPGGRSRKYSIEDIASHKLRQNVPGVISTNGRYAVPSAHGTITETINGIDGLRICGLKEDVKNEEVVLGAGEDKKKATTSNNKMTPRSHKGGRKRKSVRRSLLTPGQKLITDMIVGGAEMKENLDKKSAKE